MNGRAGVGETLASGSRDCRDASRSQAAPRTAGRWRAGGREGGSSRRPRRERAPRTPAPPRRASGAVKKPICLVPLAVHGRCFITAAQPTRTVAGDRPHARPCLRLPPQNFLGLPPPLHLCPRDLPPGAPSTLRDWSLLVGGGLPHRWGPQARDVTHSGVLSSWDCSSPGSSPGARWKHPGARSAFILGAPLGAGRTRCPIAQKGRWKLGTGQLHKGPQAHWALSGIGGWGDPGPGPDQSTPPHSPPQAGTSDTGSSSPRSPWSRRRSGPACTGTAGLWSGSTRSPLPDLLDRGRRSVTRAGTLSCSCQPRPAVPSRAPSLPGRGGEEGTARPRGPCQRRQGQSAARKLLQILLSSCVPHGGQRGRAVCGPWVPSQHRPRGPRCRPGGPHPHFPRWGSFRASCCPPHETGLLVHSLAPWQPLCRLVCPLQEVSANVPFSGCRETPEGLVFSFGRTHGSWMFPGHGSNPSRRSDPGWRSCRARSLTGCATRELPVTIFRL